MYELYIEDKPVKGWAASVPEHNVHYTYVKLSTKKQITSMIRSRTYQSWYSMVIKIHYPHPDNADRHQCYWEAGTRICKRWIEGDGIKSGFLCFLEDMGERPEGMTIDRIDPNGHYTPDNCRWADAKTQASNKRKRKKVA